MTYHWHHELRSQRGLPKFSEYPDLTIFASNIVSIMRLLFFLNHFSVFFLSEFCMFYKINRANFQALNFFQRFHTLFTQSFSECCPFKSFEPYQQFLSSFQNITELFGTLWNFQGVIHKKNDTAQIHIKVNTCYYISDTF